MPGGDITGPSIGQDQDESSRYLFEERFLTLFTFQQDGWLCDITLACDDGMVQAHRVVLAITCTYFRQMFRSAMVESSSDTVTMVGFTVDTMTTIVRYLYTNELTLTKDTALPVLRAANLLCLKKVEESCCVEYLGMLNKTTALDYALLTEQFGLSDLLRQSVSVLVKDYKQYELEKLDFNTFRMLLESDELNVGDEEEVFALLVRWVRYDRDGRIGHFRDLLTHVRLPLLSPGYLVDTVERSEFVRESLECRDLVDEGKNRHLLPERSQGYLSERMTPRRSTVGYVFLIGGLTVKERILSTVERYDLPLQQSVQMPDMSLPRRNLGTAIIEKTLYAIGGHDGSKSLRICESLDFGRGTWTWVRQLQRPRKDLGVCTNGHLLFAVGGQTDSAPSRTVEVFYPREGQWRTQPMEMSTERKYISSVHHRNSLFVVGGNDGSGYLDTCERYDLRTGKWEVLASLPHAFGANGLAIWDDKVVAVGGFDGRQCLDVSFSYDSQSDEWSRLPGKMSTRRSGLGAVTAGHKLYSFGGHSGESYLDSVEVWNGESWADLAPLKTRRGAMGVACLENCYMTNPG